MARLPPCRHDQRDHAEHQNSSRCGLDLGREDAGRSWRSVKCQDLAEKAEHASEKKLAAIIKLQIHGWCGTPGPPVGPGRWAARRHIMEFARPTTQRRVAAPRQRRTVEYLGVTRTDRFTSYTRPAGRAAAAQWPPGRREGQRRAAQDQGRQGTRARSATSRRASSTISTPTTSTTPEDHRRHRTVDGNHGRRPDRSCYRLILEGTRWPA